MDVRVKKAECQRIDAFELWCWWELLRVPWRARRSNQSILKETGPEYSLEGLMLKLKLQYFGHLIQRADSLEKTLMLERIEDRRKRGRQRRDVWIASPTRWTWVWASSGSWWWTRKPGMLQSMGSQIVGHDWATELILKLLQSCLTLCDSVDWGLPGSSIYGILLTRIAEWVAMPSSDFILCNFKPPLFKQIFFSIDIFQIGLLRLCLYSSKSYQLVHSKKSTERKKERERGKKERRTWYHKKSV